MSEQRDLARMAEGCKWARREEIEGIDLSVTVYPVPLWTARDVLLHCSFWNIEATKAIEAHIDGGAYVTDTGSASFDEDLDTMYESGIQPAKVHLNGSAHVAHIDAVSYRAGLDAMNQRVVEASRSLTHEQVHYRWVLTQNGFIEALLSLDDDALARPITCPWHERKPVSEMMEDLLLHEQDHIDDVLTASASSGPPI